MIRRPHLKLLPTIIFLLLAGCGGGGGGTSAAPVDTSHPPSSGTGASDTGGSNTGGSNTGGGTAEPTLASAITLADGTAVGASNWSVGSTASGGQGQPVGSLQCTPPGANYTYAHLSIFRNGAQLSVPTNIGAIPPSLAFQTGCVYPLHTNDASGKIRIDASAAAPTLGQFFNIWGQPLSSSNVAGVIGQATAYIKDADGTLTKYTGDLAAIELKPKREITLVVGTPPAQIPTYSWSDPPPLDTATPIALIGNGQVIGTRVWPDGGAATGQTVDGVVCAAGMSEDFHIHSHLAIIQNGQMLAIPADIGVTGTCNYEIHTHSAIGELHVETPNDKRFTLGQFFDIWGQPLTTTNVAGLTGQPIKFYINDNGDVREYIGNPADIELGSHRSITIQVGSQLSAIPSYSWDTEK